MHTTRCSGELESFVADGTLSQLHVAHSRDPGAAHRYVQDSLRADAAAFRQCVRALSSASSHRRRLMLEGGAAFYMCGSGTAMGAGVDATVDQVLMEVVAVRVGCGAEDATGANGGGRGQSGAEDMARPAAVHQGDVGLAAAPPLRRADCR